MTSRPQLTPDTARCHGVTPGLALDATLCHSVMSSANVLPDVNVQDCIDGLHSDDPNLADALENRMREMKRVYVEKDKVDEVNVEVRDIAGGEANELVSAHPECGPDVCTAYISLENDSSADNSPGDNLVLADDSVLTERPSQVKYPPAAVMVNGPCSEDSLMSDVICVNSEDMPANSVCQTNDMGAGAVASQGCSLSADDIDNSHQESHSIAADTADTAATKTDSTEYQFSMPIDEQNTDDMTQSYVSPHPDDAMQSASLHPRIVDTPPLFYADTPQVIPDTRLPRCQGINISQHVDMPDLCMPDVAIVTIANKFTSPKVERNKVEHSRTELSKIEHSNIKVDHCLLDPCGQSANASSPSGHPVSQSASASNPAGHPVNVSPNKDAGQTEALLRNVVVTSAADQANKDHTTGVLSSQEDADMRQLVKQLQTMLTTQLSERERLQAANERLGRELAAMATGASPDRGRGGGGEKIGGVGKGVAVGLTLDGKQGGGGGLGKGLGAGLSSEAQLIAKIAMLESTVSQQQKEYESLRTGSASLESALRRDLVAAQAEHQVKLDQLTRALEEGRREKDSVVVRYAQSEQRNIELSERVARSDARLRDWAKERDVAVQRFNAMKSEGVRTARLLEVKDAEVAALKKEVEYQKELSTSGDVQAKFHHDRLKGEQEVQRELKTRLDEVTLRVTESAADWELMRDELALLRRAYQVAHHTVTTTALQHTKSRLETALQQSNKNRDQVVVLALRELTASVIVQQGIVEKLYSTTEQLAGVEKERAELREAVASLEARLTSAQGSEVGLRDAVRDLDSARTIISELEERVEGLKRRMEEVEQSEADMLSDRALYQQREGESLAFTARISDINSQLQSHNITLRAELDAVKQQADELAANNALLARTEAELTGKLRQSERAASEATTALRLQIDQLTNGVAEFKVRATDAEDELKTTKRQQASIVKDLTRQLQAANRRCVGGETDFAESRSCDLKGSCGDQKGARPVDLNWGESDGSLDVAISAGFEILPPVSHEEEPFPRVSVVEIDRQRLLDKIVSLQRSHARKNEKIDFLEDHVRQLSDEVTRKSRVLLHYVQREETGVLASEGSDRVKAQLAARGGSIMASLYNTQAQDAGMTVELALEICHKLQDVLEDALLKNITLKIPGIREMVDCMQENMETLGGQVAQLTQERATLAQQVTVLTQEVKRLRNQRQQAS